MKFIIVSGRIACIVQVVLILPVGVAVFCWRRAGVLKASDAQLFK